MTEVAWMPLGLREACKSLTTKQRAVVADYHARGTKMLEERDAQLAMQSAALETAHFALLSVHGCGTECEVCQPRVTKALAEVERAISPLKKEGA